MSNFFHRHAETKKGTMDSAFNLSHSAKKNMAEKDSRAIQLPNQDGLRAQKNMHRILASILAVFLLSISLILTFFYFIHKKSVDDNPQSSKDDSFIQDITSSTKISLEEKSNPIVPQKSEPQPENIASDPTNDEAATKNDFSFAIIGDTQEFEPGNHEGGLQQTMLSIKKKKPNFIIAMGDLLSSCDGESKCANKLNNWKGALGEYFPRTYPVMGNHDRTGKSKADILWKSFFTLPENGPTGMEELVYSFDYNNYHFIILNSDKPKEGLINKTQIDWLELDLAKNKGKRNFVFFHEPAYPAGSKIGEGLDAHPQERDALWKIFQKNNIEAVFSGHEHIQNYKKVFGIDQFIFGNTDSFNHEAEKHGSEEFSYQGKAFGIVSVSKDSIQVQFFTIYGELLKTILLT